MYLTDRLAADDDAWDAEVPPEYRYSQDDPAPVAAPERLLRVAGGRSVRPPSEPPSFTNPTLDNHPQSPTQHLLDVAIPEGRLTLTVEETARLLRIGRTAGYEAAKRGDLPSRRLNGRIVIPVPALLQWLGVEPPHHGNAEAK